jgi:hypothetical protein
MKMVVHLDWLAPYQGTVRDECPYGGSSGSSWRVINVTTEPRGRKATMITDTTSTALEKEEMVIRQ